MATFESAIRDLLEAQGFTDSSASVPTFWLAVEQDQPDFSVTVIPEVGSNSTRRLGEFPSFTVRVRHTNAGEAHLLARRIFEFLHEFQGRIGSDPTWPVARITGVGTPAPLGRDRAKRNGRWRVSQTFNAITRFVTHP